jgi:hypothetical protein
MGFCTNELTPDAENKDGHWFKVKIETGMGGLARLNVECLKPDSNDAFNSQGADLTAAECRSLAKMLLATAELVDESE